MMCGKKWIFVAVNHCDVSGVCYNRVSWSWPYNRLKAVCLQRSPPHFHTFSHHPFPSLQLVSSFPRMLNFSPFSPSNCPLPLEYYPNSFHGLHSPAKPGLCLPLRLPVTPLLADCPLPMLLFFPPPPPNMLKLLLNEGLCPSCSQYFP